jgi:hypothetical protein
MGRHRKQATVSGAPTVAKGSAPKHLDPSATTNAFASQHAEGDTLRELLRDNDLTSFSSVLANLQVTSLNALIFLDLANLQPHSLTPTQTHMLQMLQLDARKLRSLGVIRRTKKLYDDGVYTRDMFEATQAAEQAEISKVLAASRHIIAAVAVPAAAKPAAPAPAAAKPAATAPAAAKPAAVKPGILMHPASSEMLVSLLKSGTDALAPNFQPQRANGPISLDGVPDGQYDAVAFVLKDVGGPVSHTSGVEVGDRWKVTKKGTTVVPAFKDTGAEEISFTSSTNDQLQRGGKATVHRADKPADAITRTCDDTGSISVPLCPATYVTTTPSGSRTVVGGARSAYGRPLKNQKLDHFETVLRPIADRRQDRAGTTSTPNHRHLHRRSDVIVSRWSWRACPCAQI